MPVLNNGVWEVFLDPAYYDMWAVRHSAYRSFEQAFHLSSEGEARRLAKLLNSDNIDPGKAGIYNDRR